ncbi:M48 family metallopeptidase [Haladaptatus halobius]|uniref:M48 family metallopeptidase n=1 Tax=Haladaptatus halobius TaxID=2884875 RepID=UPI001D09B9C5|nr:M48 family metalloprotease [Haladaptatus halobius]
MALVRSVAQRADALVPRVYVAPTATPLSLTTGFWPRNVRLVVSESLVETLADAELEAIVAHVTNRDTAVMTAATLPIGAADRVVTLLMGHTRGVEYGQPSRASYADALMTLGLIFVPPIWVCGYVLWASLSRTREFAADRGAVAITGNPTALANALGRLDEEIATRSTIGLRSAEIAAFAIVESNRTAPVGSIPLLGRPLAAAFPTHSATATQIDRLREAERAQEQVS